MLCTPDRKLRIASRALAATLLATAPGLLRAADYTWLSASGDYFDSANWIGGTVPTSTDSAFFTEVSAGPGLTETTVFGNGSVSANNVGISGLFVNWQMLGDVASTQTYLNGGSIDAKLILRSQDGNAYSWTTGTIGGYRAVLDVGPNVTVRTNFLSMQASELDIAEGGALRMVAGADGHSQAARFNSADTDTIANVRGTFESTGLIVGNVDYGLGTKPVVNVDGANAILLDHGQDDGSGFWQPSAIGRGDTMPVYGEMNVLNGASATFEGDLVVGWASTAAVGEGVLNVVGSRLSAEGDVILGQSGGKGTLDATSSTVDIETLRLGDHQGSRSTLNLTNSTANLGYVFVGGTDPFGAELSDTAHLTVTGSTLTSNGIQFTGHQNDDYTLDIRNSAVTTVLLEVAGGHVTMDGGTLNVIEQAPYFSGLRVETSTQGVTPSRVDLKNLTADLSYVLVGDGNQAANGGAVFTATDVTMTSKNGIDTGNGNGATGTARTELTRVTETGGEFSALAVGRRGVGTTLVQNSNLTNAWLFVGDLTDGNGSLELHDSSVIANHQDTNGLAYDIRIGGSQGFGDVNLYNSSLTAQDVIVDTHGTLRGDGWIDGDPLSGGVAFVTNYGTISPGHSPGHLGIDGTLQAFGKLILEIDLSNPASYDTLSVSELLMAGGTLELRALGTGTWDPTRTYNLISFGSLSGTFDNFVIDPKFTGLTAASFTVNGNVFGINPNPVPEPATLVVLGLGALAMRRRRK